MPLDWRFWLGLWLGLRRSLDFARVEDIEEFRELEEEILERLQIELEESLGL